MSLFFSLLSFVFLNFNFMLAKDLKSLSTASEVGEHTVVPTKRRKTRYAKEMSLNMPSCHIVNTLYFSFGQCMAVRKIWNQWETLTILDQALCLQNFLWTFFFLLKKVYCCHTCKNVLGHLS